MLSRASPSLKDSLIPFMQTLLFLQKTNCELQLVFVLINV
jgi:hypothetical protein